MTLLLSMLFGCGEKEVTTTANVTTNEIVETTTETTNEVEPTVQTTTENTTVNSTTEVGAVSTETTNTDNGETND
jgi:hypothetical protein